MPDPATTRRRFLTYFSSVGLSSTLLPGVLWARVQEEKAGRITAAMLKDALAVAGLDFTEERQISRAFCFAVALAVLPVTLVSQSPNVESNVDAVFATWTSSTPGCAVGIATGGRPVLAKGYGMADLEHDVRISPDSLFEAGHTARS